MEGVEDIPGAVMAEGLTWEWESYPDYLDAVARRPHDIDVALAASLAPLRKSLADINLFALLPPAFAMSFMCAPCWSSISYNSSASESFSGNQHCIALTVAKLLVCFAPVSRQPLDDVQRTMTAFIEAGGSNNILQMRIRDSVISSLPVRSLSALLEL